MQLYATLCTRGPSISVESPGEFMDVCGLVGQPVGSGRTIFDGGGFGTFKIVGNVWFYGWRALGRKLPGCFVFIFIFGELPGPQTPWEDVQTNSKAFARWENADFWGSGRPRRPQELPHAWVQGPPGYTLSPCTNTTRREAQDTQSIGT